MEPNYQQPQPQLTPDSGLDYLNAIATPAQTKTINPLILWGLIAAALIVVIVVIISIASGGNNPTKQLTLVGTSTTDLQELTEAANNDIRSSELRSINSSLTLTLTNTNRDLAEPLKKQKINLKNVKQNKTVATVTGVYDKVDERLEDARLNGLYDRTYVREVTFLLKTLHADMEELFNSSRSKSLKATLETNDNNLAPLLESLESFKAD